MRRRSLDVAVLAIDPSSPFSGGAILGDRVRMQDHATDAGVFIRSMATRGHLGGLALAVFNVDGEFFVTDDACTHGPGSLSEGYLDGDVIECNFHGGQFNVRPGEVLSPPCMVPVRTYAVTVEHGMVIIDVLRSDYRFLHSFDE
jgi:nitrite reductase/ring-hydroxylating ferredoxin subunit